MVSLFFWHISGFFFRVLWTVCSTTYLWFNIMIFFTDLMHSIFMHFLTQNISILFQCFVLCLDAISRMKNLMQPINWDLNWFAGTLNSHMACSSHYAADMVKIAATVLFYPNTTIHFYLYKSCRGL